MTYVSHAWGKAMGQQTKNTVSKKILKFLNIRFLKGGVSSQEEGFCITANFTFLESRNIFFGIYLHYK